MEYFKYFPDVKFQMLGARSGQVDSALNKKLMYLRI